MRRNPAVSDGSSASKNCEDVHVLEVEGEAPLRAVDLDPDRVLAPGREPGRLEDPDGTAAEPREEHRGVVDGDLADGTAVGPVHRHPASAPDVSPGERPLVDEGLEQPVDGDDVRSPVMCWVRSTTWAPMSPSAPDPALSFSSRQVIGASGSTSQSWRYCARTCRISPSRPCSTSRRARRDGRHPAVGEADHRPDARARPRVRPPAAIASASATVFASGFSQSTCLPASSAAMAISRGCCRGCRCRRGRCRRGRAAGSSRSRSTPSRAVAAASATRPASRPHSARIRGVSGRSKKWGAVRQAWEWAAPMKAYPTMPTPRSGASGSMRCPSVRVRVGVVRRTAGRPGVIPVGPLLRTRSRGPCSRRRCPW